MGEKRKRLTAAASLLRQAFAAHGANRLDEAKSLYRQTLQLAPETAEAWFGLGRLARQVGAAAAAIEALSKGSSLAPNDANLRTEYASALQEADRIDEAAAEFEAVCRLRPRDPLAWQRVAIARQGLGEIDAARDAYHRADALHPDAANWIRAGTITSPIVSSQAALIAERARLDSELDRLLAEPGLAITDPLRAGLWPNFYLAFHGENDRDLQTKFAALYRRACPALDYVAPHCRRPRRPREKIRVGLVSKFFFRHSIGRTSRGLFARISRAGFEVTAILVSPIVEDSYSEFIRAHADRVLVVPQELERARELIAALELDVLFYQDIGMEPFTYFLAFSRLAPVQCVSFGHPDTTGIPTVDWWVSNDLFEPEGAAAHYSEKLHMLRDVATLAYYYRPELPKPPRRRVDFGLPERGHVYLCPQNLFKFHPDMDTLLAGVLRRDSEGRVVVIAGRVAHWTDLIRERWRAAIPDVVDRIIVLPRQEPDDFLSLIALADVMLDTVHFNGMNTSLEAFAVATPVVTLPGAFQRGRHTQAMYRKMGLGELVCPTAERYVDLAVRLGSEREQRDAVSAAIMQRNAVLFEDSAVVSGFEAFFRDAVANALVAEAR